MEGEGPSLTQHEIIKFLTLRGGRCTNFELVSNFRGALNHPLHQAENRLKFKDIVNTVANVGEFQNVKYIELKREYIDNNVGDQSPPGQPSSLSSDSGGSYVSPLSQNQTFQPYWRYRLSTSIKVPTLPAKTPDFEAYKKPQTVNSTPSHLERSVSESTLSQTVADIRPPPRTKGKSPSGFNRSLSANPPERLTQNPGPLVRKTSFVGEEYITKRSSINGYPPVDYTSLPLYQQANSNQHFKPSADPRRNFSAIVPEKQPGTQWGPRSVPSHSSLSHSQSFSGCHGNVPPAQSTQYGSSKNLERWTDERPYIPPRTSGRSPKRSGICNDDLLQELEEDSSKSYTNETSISESFDRMHGIKSENKNAFYTKTEDANREKLPDNSYNNSFPNKSHNQSQVSASRLENKQHLRAPVGLKNGFQDTKEQSKPVNRNLFPSSDHQQTCNNSVTTDNSESLDDSNSDTVSLCSSTCSRDKSITDVEPVGRGEEFSIGLVENKTSDHGDAPPVPPERRRKQSRTASDIVEESNTKQVPRHDLLPNNTGKVKDRVQQFDDLEKKRTHSKRQSPPLQDKENRNSKILMEDDISISVLDPKLKREWFVKAAQGDYYALVGLLKKEPKLAAIKDIASTALHWGAKHGDANIVKLIAGTYRVNPNIRSGYTPIHLATMYKHTMIVDLLVHTYGADASVRDYSGKRADQYPDNYVRKVAGLKTTERRPLKVRPLEKDSSGVSSFMRIGSLNLRKSRKSTVFASVRGRNWGSATELRLNNYKSTRKKNAKSVIINPPDKKGETESKNDSDSDSAYGFYSK